MVRRDKNIGVPPFVVPCQVSSQKNMDTGEFPTYNKIAAS